MCTAASEFRTLILIVFGVITLMVFFGNILILSSIIKFKNLQSAMFILIGNIAVADLLLGIGLVISFIFWLVDLVIEQQIICVIQYSLVSVSMCASAGNILLMSVERFLAVVFPLKHRSYASNRVYVTSAVVVGWIFYVGTGFSFIYFVMKNRSHKGLACDQQLIVNQPYYSLTSLFIIVITVVTSVLCVVVLTVAIRMKTRTKRRGKTALMLVVFCFFAVSWFPYNILNIVLNFQHSSIISCLKDWFVCLAIINSGINWIIYGLLNPKMRLAFRKIVCCGQTMDSRHFTSS